MKSYFRLFKMNEYENISLCLNSLHAGVRQYPGNDWCNTLEEPTGIIVLFFFFFCNRLCMFRAEERAVENTLTLQILHKFYKYYTVAVSTYLNFSQPQSRGNLTPVDGWRVFSYKASVHFSCGTDELTYEKVILNHGIPLSSTSVQIFS